MKLSIARVSVSSCTRHTCSRRSLARLWSLDFRSYRDISPGFARKVFEAFSSRLREEVDLDSLGAELLAVVAQTMQPERLSLWIRPATPRRNS